MPNAELIERTFEGFYADLDQVRRPDGSRRIVKRFRRRGIAEPEARALTLLRQHTPAEIEVPALLDIDLDGAHETLTITYIDGVPAGSVVTEHPDAAAEQIIDVAAHWHAQRGTAFEDLSDTEHPDFASAYG